MYVKLREIRRSQKYTTQDMGEKLGISKAFYCQIENEKRRLSYPMAYKIAKIFKMKPDALFYEETSEKND